MILVRWAPGLAFGHHPGTIEGMGSSVTGWVIALLGAASTAAPEPEPTPVVAPVEPTPTPAPPADVGPSTPRPTPPTDPAAGPPREYPRLVLTAGILVGPHAIGNEQCDTEEARCETKGSFFGVGGNTELRARLYRPLYLHIRGYMVRNVSPNDPIYDGLAGGGVGLGAHGRRVFGRAEYLLISAFGDNRFEPPFFDGDVAYDRWGNHAGMLAVGFRQPLPRGLAIELWGGPMFGPRSVRRVPPTEPDRRVLTTFMLGLGLAWDAVK